MGGDVASSAATAALAERAGFSSAWTAEFYDRSATVSLAAMALATSRIRLGSAIMYALARTPLLTIAECRDLDELSGGRFVLGLGTGTRQQVSAWHGQEAEHLAPRLEELVPLLRRLWQFREGAFSYEGRFYRMRLKPTLPVRAPHCSQLQVWLAGVNPRMIEAAGYVGDGLIGHPLFTPEYVAEVVRPALARGASRAARSDALPIAGYLICAVSDDAAEARRDAASQIGFSAVVRAFEPIRVMHGFEREVASIREAMRVGDMARIPDLVSERMLETFAVFGTPEEARQRYRARFQGVYDEPLLLYPCMRVDPGRLCERMSAMIEAFKPLAARDNRRGP